MTGMVDDWDDWNASKVGVVEPLAEAPRQVSHDILLPQLLELSRYALGMWMCWWYGMELS